MTIVGMPIVSFLAFLSWPFVFVIVAIIVYKVMAKQDALIDDTEFEKSIKGREGGDNR